jgi:hypothetical protein
VLEVPLEEMVVRLQDVELGQAELTLELERGAEPLRSVVRGPDVVDRPHLDQRVEGAQGLLQEGGRVIEVRVVEVDDDRLRAAMVAPVGVRGIDEVTAGAGVRVQDSA